MCVEPKQNANIIAYRNAGNCPCSQILRPLEIGGQGLSLFRLMVNPRLATIVALKKLYSRLANGPSVSLLIGPHA